MSSRPGEERQRPIISQRCGGRSRLTESGCCLMRPARLPGSPDKMRGSRMRDLDIWRAANLLIRQHGDQAEIEASRLADLMLDRGDCDGELVWLRVRSAIADLQAPPI